MEEPKKVYLVMAGDYSDYSVLAVCSNRKRAEQLCKLINRKDEDKVCGYQATIEEYPVDSIYSIGPG